MAPVDVIFLLVDGFAYWRNNLLLLARVQQCNVIEALDDSFQLFDGVLRFAEQIPVLLQRIDMAAEGRRSV